MANFVKKKKNPFDLNIFLSHMKYGRKIIICESSRSFAKIRHSARKITINALYFMKRRLEAKHNNGCSNARTPSSPKAGSLSLLAQNGLIKFGTTQKILELKRTNNTEELDCQTIQSFLPTTQDFHNTDEMLNTRVYHHPLHDQNSTDYVRMASLNEN